MQLLQPLGIIPIGLSTGDSLDVAGIDQIGRNAGLFEQLVDRDPKHPG